MSKGYVALITAILQHYNQPNTHNKDVPAMQLPWRLRCPAASCSETQCTTQPKPLPPRLITVGHP